MRNLEEEELAIIEDISEALERKQRDKVPAHIDILKKGFLEETAKVNKVFLSLKHTVLQRLMNYFMQELLLQIGWK